MEYPEPSNTAAVAIITNHLADHRERAKHYEQMLKHDTQRAENMREQMEHHRALAAELEAWLEAQSVT